MAKAALNEEAASDVRRLLQERARRRSVLTKDDLAAGARIMGLSLTGQGRVLIRSVARAPVILAFGAGGGREPSRVVQKSVCFEDLRPGADLQGCSYGRRANAPDPDLEHNHIARECRQ
tara:strand:+ start:198 stop:554 length:357 start_codon:yes stop_codon:yes gene_type:complete